MARTIAVSVPTRISASAGAPRKLSSVARYASASAKLVLPWPFSPTTAVVPGWKANEAVRVVAEVDQLESGDDHCGTVRRTGQGTRTGISR